MQIGRDPYDQLYKNVNDFVGHEDVDTVLIHDVPIPPSSSSNSSHDNSNAILDALQTLKLDMHNLFDSLQASMTNFFQNCIDSLQVHFDRRLDDYQRTTSE